MIKLRQAIVVEGRYDKNALCQLVDAPVIETHGFGVMKDRRLLGFLRQVAAARGLIILTDSDGAGFVIRNFLKGALPPEQVLHAYIPDVPGKERRKRAPGREGKLGVEGMPPEVLLEALRRAGAQAEDSPEPPDPITKTDLYLAGLSGGADSAARRRALQQELGMQVDGGKFMIGLVSRLTDQKGMDLIDCVMEQICAEDVQFVILGTGEERYENMFRHYDWKYNDRVSANIYYSEDMSHKVYASCDAFLMPSLFEPCGLSQLMSLRYGTVPIVRETGGLKDTVEPYNEYEGKGTGFSFANYNAHEMLSIVNYAKDVYYNHKREWNKIVDRGMKTDFSWNSSARKYEDLYNSL